MEVTDGKTVDESSSKVILKATERIILVQPDRVEEFFNQEH